MAQSKNNKTAPRAKLAHKLARYFRANPIYLQNRLAAQNPSTTHLSISNINNFKSTWRTSSKKIKK